MQHGPANLAKGVWLFDAFVYLYGWVVFVCRQLAALGLKSGMSPKNTVGENNYTELGLKTAVSNLL